MPLTPEQLQQLIRQSLASNFGNDWQAFIQSRIDTIVTQQVTEMIDASLRVRVKEVIINTGLIHQINRNIDNEP